MSAKKAPETKDLYSLMEKVRFAAFMPTMKLEDSDVEQFFGSPVWTALRQLLCNTLNQVYQMERQPGVPADFFQHAQGVKIALEYFLSSKEALMTECKKWKAIQRKKTSDDWSKERQLTEQLDQ